MCADTLIADGFEQFKADSCIFRKDVDGVAVMIVGVYVDDLFLIGGSEEDCELLLASLNKKFPTEGQLRSVHMVRWMWHRKRCYNQVVTGGIRQQLDETV